ncbi:MAG: hypothetical protein K2N38_08405 [Oscillospiraceae bacterium]|nr:hypothetical protein [Oscillospiraceae bacterium]
MIKATIQNSPYCTEIRFPCSETELSKKLGELGMNTEHLAPIGTIIEIEPVELSVLEDCDVSLDALNYLGKRMDGMCKAERNQFLAVLSCDELEIGYGLKNIINLTYNLARYTLIEDTDDLERIGRIHMLNVRGFLSEAEYSNSEWLAEEGMKLLNSGSGIDTEYGKVYVNEDVPFDEMFNGTTFPAYYCEPNSVAGVEIGYFNLTELVELPCEDIAIKKALCRLGADSVKDCKITVDSTRDISDEWSEKISEVEKTKELFGLNRLLKSEGIRLKQEQPVSIFNKEVTRQLRENDFAVSQDGDSLNVMTTDSYSVKILENGSMRVPEDCPSDSYSQIKKVMKETYDFCSAYAKAAPLKADGLSEKYRCLAEFNSTVLAAKYNEEYGFEFVTWDRTFDGKGVTQGNYYSDYLAAKENFAIRSGLIDKDKLFSTEELEQLRKCVNFTARHNGDLRFEDCQYLKKLNEKISESLPEQQQSDSPEMSM